jgi:hypothetical protein
MRFNISCICSAPGEEEDGFHQPRSSVCKQLVSSCRRSESLGSRHKKQSGNSCWLERA